MQSSRIGIGVLAVALSVSVACNKEEATSSTGTAPSASQAPKPSASAAPSAAPAASVAAVDAGPSLDAQMAEDEAVADELIAHHRHHHQAFVGFVVDAVDTLGVASDQQAAIDAARKEFHAKTKPLHEANMALRQIVADGVAAGNVDRAKVDPAIAKAAAAATAAQGATVEYLEHLHGALRPEQRAALVDKVDAHWATWREVNEHAADGAKVERHLKHIGKEVNLTKDQMDKVRATLEAAKEPKKPFDPAAMEAYVKAFDAAFVADKFDPKKLPAAGPENAHVVSWGAERMVTFYTALAPVLSPDQRTFIADKLRKRGQMPESKEKP